MASKKKNPPKAIPHDPFEDMEISEASIPDEVEIIGNIADGISPNSSESEAGGNGPHVAVESEKLAQPLEEHIEEDQPESRVEETDKADGDVLIPDIDEVDFDDLGLAPDSPEMSDESGVAPNEGMDDAVDDRILPAPLAGLIPEDAEYSLPEPVEEQHIIFSLAGRDYAAHISNIVEIGYPLNVTPLPNVPDWVLGLTNLRGDVISIFDLRAFLGFGKIPYGGETRLLIAKTLEGDFNVGLIVDSVRGIRYLNIDQIEEPVADITAQVAKYVSGSYELDERIFVLLDLQKLLSSSEMRQLEPA
jgi:purine-binding chemotaxis protein CheW